jgi:hypothetical protein
VAALHKHRKNKFFFKIDLERFYYTISRNRVAATLYDLGDPQARNHAKWSSVKNPFVFPRYSLPIGFIQSPIISAAVLMRSPMQIAIDSAQRDGITVSVYFDDIIGSANELEPLTQAYERLKSAINESSFILNTAKTVDPCDMLTAFNCHLSHNRTFVTEARIKLFDERTASVARAEAFRRYCESVSD